MSSPDSSTSTSNRSSQLLAGKRILVVEDSPVVAPYAADLLQELGCSAIGPAPTMAAARSLIESERCDGALLDVHIRGERVFPLCDLLAERGTGPLRHFAMRFPELRSFFYGRNFDPLQAVDGAALVIVHEWNDPALVAELGRIRAECGPFLLLLDLSRVCPV